MGSLLRFTVRGCAARGQARWRNKGAAAAKPPPTATPEPELTAEEVHRLAEKARRDEELWKIAAPERQWTVYSPATFVMLSMIITLQTYLYIKYDGTLPDDSAEDIKLKEETKGWDEE